jgi:ferredoxin
MRVELDDDRCGGHGTCCTLCPEVFTLTDDGYAEVADPQVPAGFEDAVREAVRTCPTQAISIA